MRRKVITLILAAAAIVPIGAEVVPASADAVPESSSSVTDSRDFPVALSREELQKQVNGVLATKGGRQTSLNEITWTYANSGEVRLLFPVPRQLEAEAAAARKNSMAAAAGTYGCPAGWACLYENNKFNGVSRTGGGPGNGRLLQFQDRNIIQDLDNWNFRNKTSSVYNTTDTVWSGLASVPPYKGCRTFELNNGGISNLGPRGDRTAWIALGGTWSAYPWC
ncbi:peptidase inhibitor family I36 protein [Streptosporangium saharense]|uniref:peptidase inhibitor family I36 protein n=1 Tax=Streptosporangium saharense TaxID=1706840 RepID=UPI00332C897A